MAIKGKVFDVTGNKMYLEGGSYHGKPPLPLLPHSSHIILPAFNTLQALMGVKTVFAGHDASRALALTSTKAEDVKPEWQDLEDDKKKVLDDWMTFFSKRYNVVGLVEGSTNQ